VRRIWGDRGTRLTGRSTHAANKRSTGPSDEHGAILVLVALLLPLFLTLSVVVVDVGDWYVHTKRLQTLVDAGAFAGGTKFVGCSFQFGDPVAANTAIKATALEYSGVTRRVTRGRETCKNRNPTTFESSSTAGGTGRMPIPSPGSASTTRSTMTVIRQRREIRAARGRSTSRRPTTMLRSSSASSRW